MIFFSYRQFIKLTLMVSTLWIAISGLEAIIYKHFNGDFLSMRAIAQAQQFTQQQLESYAQAILKIEPLRQRTFQEIQRILDSQEVPSIACNRRTSYEDLPSPARSAIINYCNRSKEIVQEQGLTVSEFNSITAEINSDSDIKEQVQEAMLELR